MIVYSRDFIIGKPDDYSHLTAIFRVVIPKINKSKLQTNAWNIAT